MKRDQLASAIPNTPERVVTKIGVSDEVRDPEGRKNVPFQISTPSNKPPGQVNPDKLPL